MPARTVSTAAGAADFAQLSSLTNLNDINRLLHETIAWERSIEADLDKQLGRRTELERDILQLNAATSEVCLLVCVAAELLSGSVIVQVGMVCALCTPGSQRR